MNLSIPKRFLIITAVLYAGSFLFFAVLNFIQFAPKDIDIYFKSGWIINNSLLMFLDNLTAVQCAAVVFTFSVFYPGMKAGEGAALITSKTFNQLVTFVIIILLVLTALFFSGNEILKPRVHTKLDSYEYLTKISRACYIHAEEAAAEGRLFEAEDMIKRYLAIKPGDPDGTDLHRSITARIENQYRAGAAEAAETEPGTAGLELTYKDAMRLAENYLKTGDYYSAYYYAQIAAKLSNNSQAARSLTSEAWTALSETEPSKEESEAFSLYSRKKRGTELLLAGKPIEAYYLFNQLKVEYPSDPDVSKYLNESIRETRKLTYFIDEAEEVLNFPGVSDICFLNPGDRDVSELFYCSKMVTAEEGTFFENIETIKIDGTGVLSHITAEYGKLEGDHIVLNGIDRENRDIRLYPEYIVSDKVPNLFNTIKLNLDRNDIPGLSSTENIYQKMNIIELYEYESVIAGYGWPVEPLYLEIIMRILSPCAFIILSLITIAISWKYRRFAGKLPISGLVLSPVVFYASALFAGAYIYGVKLLCSWIFLGFGRPAAQILLAVSQIVLLIAAFLMIAGLGAGFKNEKN